MKAEFFEMGDKLMVSIVVDSSNTVTRPATDTDKDQWPSAWRTFTKPAEEADKPKQRKARK